jgi:hypothetical protein
MRRFLLTATALGALALTSGAASAQVYYSADVYAPGAASAQVYYSADVYAPPAAAYGPPAAAYGPPPGTVYVNPGAPVVAQGPMVDRQVYLAPGAQVVTPGTEYNDAPIVVDGRQYYRDCWWDWGRRRCELKPWNW